LKYVLGVLFSALVAVIVTVVFQQPLEDWWSSNRLNAVLYTGPWIPYPDEKGNLDWPPTIAVTAERGKELIQNDYGFAAVDFVNNGREEIANGKIRFKSLFTPEAYYPAGFGRQAALDQNPTEINLPTIKPGERYRMYLWKDSDFPWSYYLDDIATYSSAGPIRISIAQPDREHTEDTGWLARYYGVTDYLMFGLAALIVLGFGAAASTHERYWRKLLRDDSFYLDEKVRFDSDEKHFAPTF
jgi:hypothetical protein